MSEALPLPVPVLSRPRRPLSGGRSFQRGEGKECHPSCCRDVNDSSSFSIPNLLLVAGLMLIVSAVVAPDELVNFPAVEMTTTASAGSFSGKGDNESTGLLSELVPHCRHTAASPYYATDDRGKFNRVL